MVAEKRKGSADYSPEADSPSPVPSRRRPSASPERVLHRDRGKCSRGRHGSADLSFAGVAEHELLNAIVTGSSSALVVVDLNGVTLLWNAAVERLFGWSAAEVVGRPLQFIEFSSPAESQRLRKRAAAGHDALEVQARRRHRDGHLLDVAVSTVGLHDPSGRVVAVLGTYHEATELKAADDLLVR